ncbi:MAG: DNA/RNA non-specific endonuclease [Rickettsiaceae bacterium H1]|nr:DNA/RNA non-specific endonuclease [Rickettsiaceae bacterium H1]
MKEFGRIGTFRPDYRIPEMFQADLANYKDSGYDRGHLAASSDQQETKFQNSETFLLSNTCPQKPNFNRILWRELEYAIKDLDKREEILKTYVVSGPIFCFEDSIKFIGLQDKSNIGIPIPSAFFKSMLTEDIKGRLNIWSFIMPNKESNKSPSEFRVPTKKVERYAGIKLWSTLQGSKIEKDKETVKDMWEYTYEQPEWAKK